MADLSKVLQQLGRLVEDDDALHEHLSGRKLLVEDDEELRRLQRAWLAGDRFDSGARLPFLQALRRRRLQPSAVMEPILEDLARDLQPLLDKLYPANFRPVTIRHDHEIGEEAGTTGWDKSPAEMHGMRGTVMWTPGGGRQELDQRTGETRTVPHYPAATGRIHLYLTSMWEPSYLPEPRVEFVQFHPPTIPFDDGEVVRRTPQDGRQGPRHEYPPQTPLLRSELLALLKSKFPRARFHEYGTPFNSSPIAPFTRTPGTPPAQ